MNEFKLGDRVLAENFYVHNSNSDIKGEIGTIVEVNNLSGLYGVDFDNHIGGHDCFETHTAKKGHGWYLSAVSLSLESAKKVNKNETKSIFRIYTARNHPFYHHSTITNSDGTTENLVELVKESTHKAIYNNRTVIVILDDGSKGISKCSPDDEYNSLKGLEIANLRAYIKKAQKDLKKLLK